MPPPLRICHLITTLDVGGAQQALCRLVERMDRARFASEVVSLVEPGVLAERLRALDVPVRGLGMARGQPSPAGVWRLTAHLARSAPALLQTWLYHADLAGLLAGRLARVPHIVWNVRAADMDMSQYGRLSGLTRRACAWLSPAPDAVVVNSEAGLRHHDRLGYRPRRWVLIPNGIDTTAFEPDAELGTRVRAELGFGRDELVVGLVARVDPMKGHATFVQAAERLGEALPCVRFLLVGDGTGEGDSGPLQERLARSPVRPHVVGLGRRLDVARLMTAMDLVTQTSPFGEGFPNAIAEAMACGVPCVVTDVGDAAALVGETGVVVAPGDVDGLVAAWRRLLAEPPAERHARGLRARARIEARFDLAATVGRYERLYEHLVSGRPLEADSGLTHGEIR